MSKCKFCGKDITWMKEDKKFRAINSDGEYHSCEEMQQSKKSIKVINPSSLSKEEIAEYEKKINSK
ncbi:MAG: hypothetical protein ISR65_05635 [Bacteriovoracaceae bacterium]|nr:hypothetical protein [Bacteriovoracaceae bacterium]